MVPILYPPDETEFTSNGIGRLPDATYCVVEEERNGVFELEMHYPVTGRHYSDIMIDRIIGVIHDDRHDLQPFDIYKISKPMGGIVTVNARHISYRLTKQTLLPMTAGSCAEVFAMLPQHILNGTDFVFWTDKEVSAYFRVNVPQAVRGILGGQAGSVLDVFGKADYEWDKWTVKLHAHRGRRTGQLIRYGKNLLDITQTLDAQNAYNAVVPFWHTDESNVTVMLPETFITRDGVSDEPLQTVPMDLSDAFESEPTVDQLRSKARQRLAQPDVGLLSENITIDFAQLWQTEEYKNVAALQRLSLCDEVDVYHKELGILARNVQIIKVRYDVLAERYVKMELGEPKTSLGSAITDTAITEVLKTVPTKSTLQRAVDIATSLITGGLGGHVVIGRDANGKPNEILIMDTEDAATAVNVLRINMNGIGFSTTGYNGPFKSAWTIDGHFVADFIDTGTLNANLLRAGIIASKDGKNFWNLDTGELSLLASSIIDSSGQSIEDALENAQVGARNLIINSRTLIYKDYYFTDSQGIGLDGALVVNDGHLIINGEEFVVRPEIEPVSNTLLVNGHTFYINHNALTLRR